MHYESSLEGLDLAKQEATFSTADGKRKTAPYDLLIATDGAHVCC